MQTVYLTMVPIMASIDMSNRGTGLDVFKWIYGNATISLHVWNPGFAAMPRVVHFSKQDF